jgi:hypothetical protein
MEKDSRVLPPVPVLPINKETGPFHQGPGSLFSNTPQEGAFVKDHTGDSGHRTRRPSL